MINKFKRAIFPSTTKLTKAQQADLALMRADNTKSHEQYRPGYGLGWSKLVKEFEHTFSTEGIQDIELQPYNARFAANPPGSTVYYSIACNLMLRRLEARDKWGMLDKLRRSQKKPSRTHERDLRGLVVTWDILTSLAALMSIAEADDTLIREQCTILDLGAGWGRIGHTLCRINPKATYICADLPESLLISQNHLPTTLDSIQVRTYRENREEIRLQTQGLHFIGSHDLPRIPDKSIDYFLNIASFQEMKNFQVEGYLTDIDRLCCNLFYTRQINFINKKDGFVTAGKEYYPFPEHWERVYIRDAAEWDGYFEAVLKVI